ncbi:MAG: GNAT family N-acetyltransferase [Sphaerochaetaceae bacterium]|nr:GNAT family N-acetyltransferase [Sphaerochaetaceae bacterium]MDD4841741.1 GNAT family N-acetyltransferase [Sphaerochaetaceae bacterium]
MGHLNKVIEIEKTTIRIRDIELSESDWLTQYFVKVSRETDFLAIGPEAPIDPDQIRNTVEQILSSLRDICIIAVQDDEIVGALTFVCGKRPKLARSGFLGLSVIKTMWNRGIGSALLRILLDWAITNEIGKIDLKVSQDNARAIALYHKFGFVEEAVSKDQLFVKGRYVDLVWMGLKLGFYKENRAAFNKDPHPSYAFNQPIHIRSARSDDAASILYFLHLVSKETQFLSMGEEGPLISIEEERKFLNAACEDPRSLYLIAMHGKTVVGMISFSAGRRPRTQHAGEFSIAVLRAFSGIGIGRAFIQRMVHWARSQHIHKISLEVRIENIPAIRLYRSFGFVVEGRITRTVYYDGYFWHSYMMGLVLE